MAHKKNLTVLYHPRRKTTFKLNVLDTHTHTHITGTCRISNDHVDRRPMVTKPDKIFNVSFMRPNPTGSVLFLWPGPQLRCRRERNHSNDDILLLLFFTYKSLILLVHGLPWCYDKKRNNWGSTHTHTIGTPERKRWIWIWKGSTLRAGSI